ncbi:transposase [Mesorhizobium sp. M1148]|uniref:hypothetical protein n=1 Tax=unclassified Mesorhizobium TaxID=325217 RepID=UPI003335A1B3
MKSWKTHLSADRTSCTRPTANRSLRAAVPRRSSFAVAQFDTLRLRLIKIAARVVEMKPDPPAPADIVPRVFCASSSIAPPNSRHKDGAQTPRTEPADCKPADPARHHDGSPPAPDEACQKHRSGGQIAALGHQSSSPCIKAAR